MNREIYIAHVAAIKLTVIMVLGLLVGCSNYSQQDSDILYVIEHAEFESSDERLAASIDRLINTPEHIESEIVYQIISNRLSYDAIYELIDVLASRSSAESDEALFQMLVKYNGNDVEEVLYQAAVPLNKPIDGGNTLLSRYLYRSISANSIAEYRAVALATLFAENMQYYYKTINYIAEHTSQSQVINALDVAAIQIEPSSAKLIYLAMLKNSNSEFTDLANTRLDELRSMAD